MDLGKTSIEELFQFAATIEQGGFDFYSRLMQASDNKRVNNELKFLRDEEAQHRTFFMSELKKKGKNEVVVSPALNAVLEAEFLKPLEEFYKSQKISNNQEALRFGITVEQKTIDFYGDLRQQSRDPGFLKDLDVIVEQEKKHKQKLNLILAY
jgi:rubrerythrin